MKTACLIVRRDAKAALLGVVLAGGLAVANAAPITGDISFLGFYTPIDGSGTPTSLGAATGLDFNNPVLVAGATGDFASYLTPWMSTATFVDAFNFNPLVPSPVLLWMAGGFEFTMTAVDILGQSDKFLGLVGTGEIAGNGFDATVGTWSMVGGKFLFYSKNRGAPGFTDPPTPVPDGGSTMILLGAALLGIGFARAGYGRMARASA